MDLARLLPGPLGLLDLMLRGGGQGDREQRGTGKEEAGHGGLW